MEIFFIQMLFIVCVSEQIGKHVYPTIRATWPEAQQYCRDHHTDLTPITTPWEEESLKNASIGKLSGYFFVGLYKNGRTWMWSGGGKATYLPWAGGQLYNFVLETVAVVCLPSCTNGWHNAYPIQSSHFLCFNLIVSEYKATWEQSMLHCKQNHTALTSLTSETEHLLTLREIKHDNITERVWIGLRYLGDHWLWVNGDPLQYEAWPQGDQDHQCPIYKRCGALTKGGLWENWDCKEKLNFICY
ncbi:Versican core protein [Dissostichus eleginoides]|uniref:Versican core protein n=1 Tax=Dissostichus eleginoides TaxID=100907 RepID=A0AAD9F4Q8_DISEL|nr:Versican core protein [Dissostichus eleginoides]